MKSIETKDRFLLLKSIETKERFLCWNQVKQKGEIFVQINWNEGEIFVVEINWNEGEIFVEIKWNKKVSNLQQTLNSLGLEEEGPRQVGRPHKNFNLVFLKNFFLP